MTEVKISVLLNCHTNELITDLDRHKSFLQELEIMWKDNQKRKIKNWKCLVT